jgi:hypothetical protein
MNVLQHEHLEITQLPHWQGPRPHTYNLYLGVLAQYPITQTNPSTPRTAQPPLSYCQPGHTCVATRPKRKLDVSCAEAGRGEGGRTELREEISGKHATLEVWRKHEEELAALVERQLLGRRGSGEEAGTCAATWHTSYRQLTFELQGDA